MDFNHSEKRFTAKADALTLLTGHLAAGGTLDDFCRMKHLRLGAIWRWLMDDDDRKKAYENARDLMDELDKVRSRGMLRAIAFGDIRGLLDKDGSLLPPDKWPPGVAQLVAGLDIQETTTKEHVIIALKKIKLADRMKAEEQLAERAGYKAPTEIHHKVTLEDLVSSDDREDSKP